MAKKVAVWGVFDQLHEGHLEFLKNASKLGNELYVIIVPDKAVKENKDKSPINNAEERKNMILELDFVEGAYVDCLSSGLESILNLKPDIFAFGHDQNTKWEQQLKNYLQQKGLRPEYVHLSIYNQGEHGSDLKKQQTIYNTD